jgi:hypothetical protein
LSVIKSIPLGRLPQRRPPAFPDIVAGYREALRRGVRLEPITLFLFHRLEAPMIEDGNHRLARVGRKVASRLKRKCIASPAVEGARPSLPLAQRPAVATNSRSASSLMLG